MTLLYPKGLHPYIESASVLSDTMRGHTIWLLLDHGVESDKGLNQPLFIKKFTTNKQLL